MVAQILAALVIGLEQAQRVPTLLSQTPRSDVYRVCRIFNGRLSYCGRWFTGETVLPEPRRQLILAARRDTIPVALALVAGSRFAGDRPAEFLG